MSNVSEVKLSRLTSFLSSFGQHSIFAGWLCKVAPGELGLYLEERGRIRGCAVVGLPYGFFQVPGYWLFAEDRKSEEQLLNYLAEFAPGYSVSLGYSPKNPITKYNHYNQTFDLHFTLAEAKIPSGRHELKHLFDGTLQQTTLSDEIKSQIGSFADFTPDSQLFGLEQKGEIVAIAESGVRTESYATIGQVYTIEKVRGKGLGKEIVSRLATAILAEGLTPTYLVSESNLPSIALAKAVGFSSPDRLPYLEP